jgi:bacteriorhodopsin
VQLIELAFYSWYAYHFHSVAEATFYRYHDWAITTPLMLLSTMVYFDYENKPEEVVAFQSFWEEHWKDVLIIFAFNAVMLLFGYLYERNIIGLAASQVVGFAGYAGTFYVLWDKFASKTSSNAPLYWFMTIVWGFYGIAAFFPPVVKNTAYNLLDVVAKNFYGIFLSYLINEKAL